MAVPPRPHRPNPVRPARRCQDLVPRHPLIVPVRHPARVLRHARRLLGLPSRSRLSVPVRDRGCRRLRVRPAKPARQPIPMRRHHAPRHLSRVRHRAPRPHVGLNRPPAPAYRRLPSVLLRIGPRPNVQRPNVQLLIALRPARGPRRVRVLVRLAPRRPAHVLQPRARVRPVACPVVRDPVLVRLVRVTIPLPHPRAWAPRIGVPGPKAVMAVRVVKGVRQMPVRVVRVRVVPVLMAPVRVVPVRVAVSRGCRARTRR